MLTLVTCCAGTTCYGKGKENITFGNSVVWLDGWIESLRSFFSAKITLRARTTKKSDDWEEVTRGLHASNDDVLKVGNSSSAWLYICFSHNDPKKGSDDEVHIHDMAKQGNL
jgi:hypothetical protein